MKSSVNDDELKNKFCERCYYLITNFTNDESFLDRKALLNLTSNSNCNFCFGIFDLEQYKEALSSIKEQLNEIDHKDYKIAFNFSSIFDVIHHYWRTILSKTNLQCLFFSSFFFVIYLVFL